MVDIATLGIAVDSRGADQGARSLDKLTGAAKRAEAATTGVAGASSAAAGASMKAKAATTGNASAVQMHTTRLVTNTGAVKANNAALVAHAATSKQAAFQNRMLAIQLGDVAQSLALGLSPMQVLLQQGPQIQGMYGSLGETIRGVTGFILRGVAALAAFAAAAPVAVAALAGLGLGAASIKRDLDAAGHSAIGFADIAKAAFQVVLQGVNSVLKPAIAGLTSFFAPIFNWIAEKAKWIGNTVINSFRAAFEDVKFVWNQAPNIVGAAAIGASNAVIAAIESMINKATGLLDTLIGKVNSLVSVIPGMDGMQLPTIGNVSIGRIDNPYSGALSEAAAGRNSRIAEIMGSDPLGQFGEAVKAQAIANSLKEVETAAGGAGKALKGAADKAKDAWDGLRKATDETLQKVRDATNSLGQSIGGIFKGLLDKTMDWKDAALEALKSVLTYLNQMNLAKGGSGLFGGGFFQSLIGGFLGLSGFAKGGVFGPGGVTAFARGGVVNSPTVFPFKNGTGLMGEAGPEAIMPLKRGPNGALGVQVADGGSRRQSVAVSVGVTVDNDGNLKAYVKNVAQTEAATAAGKVGQAMPLVAQQTMRNTDMRRIAPTQRLVG
ncbi:phage tail length tape measure family protein [Zhengella sp. ZM62]|uniref:phage tail length tape measure family protein n=1 Tax=Zhengella sedimenti TaxID=3390035 RepID=UPI003976D5B6